MHAVCYFPGRAPAHCMVRNLSPIGALLEFNERLKVPFNFRLKIESKQLDIACRVRHQGEHGVGVTFIADSEARTNKPVTDKSPVESATDIRPIDSIPGRIIRGI